MYYYVHSLRRIRALRVRRATDASNFALTDFEESRALFIVRYFVAFARSLVTYFCVRSRRRLRRFLVFRAPDASNFDISRPSASPDGKERRLTFMPPLLERGGVTE